MLRRANLLVSLFAAAAGLFACGGDSGDETTTAPPPAPPAADQVAGIQVLSSDPAVVTGGSALLAVSLNTGTTATGVKVSVNGTDATSLFTLDAPSNSLRGLVTGLTIGANAVTATGGNGQSKSLSLTNYPQGGPVFTGPQLQPWLCSDAAAGLGNPLDAQCDVAPNFAYFYMSKASGTFQPYNLASPPAATDVATTTTDQGVTTNYIARVETGAVDRAQYQIGVLFDPSKPWTALAPQTGWNHKVYVPLQGGWTRTYAQNTVSSGSPQEAILNDMALKRGFLVTKTTFLQAGSNAEWVRGAESLMMLKELIIKNYGLIRYTFSSGASGGSITQSHIANSYPGLLQGIIPMSEFVDWWGEINRESRDCILLNRYYTGKSPALWTDASQRIAVNGHADETSCNFYTLLFTAGADPTNGVIGGVPPTPMYDPITNPTGPRGTEQDYQVNYFGHRPSTLWTAPERAAGFGFANSPNDNVGMQYGLQALQSGKISVDQFVDLNEKIGGFDIDLKPTAAREQQDPGMSNVLYRTGFVNDMSQMDKVAIISVRRADVDPVASHSIIHSFIFLDRLRKAHGSTANSALWMDADYNLFNTHELSFVNMDKWLSAVEADQSTASIAEKIVNNKPANVVDGCWDPSIPEASQTLSNQITDVNQCTNLWFPVSATPRIVAAGGDRSSTFVAKCQLKPLVQSDYSVTFTAAQWTRLQAVFPAGVCDYTKSDAAVTPSIPWLGFSAGAGGVPLAITPVANWN